MAAESNSGFRREETLGSALNRHAISFQSGAVNSSSEMIGMGSYYGVNNTTPGNLVFSGHSGIICNNSPSVSQAANSSGSLLLDSVTGLKHDTGLAVEWSAEEQYKLEEGLVKYADEPSIMRYVKIAATLRDKTVRDVALRCRWMTRKRRKQEDLGRKGSYRKDKLAESSSRTNISSTSTATVTTSSFTARQMDQSERIRWEGLSRMAKHLLEQNVQDFNQINANMSSLKLQDNIDIFCRARENISSLYTIMKEMPGRMCHMRELPVSIDLALADTILPRATGMGFNMSSGIQPKQDLRCDGGMSRLNV